MGENRDAGSPAKRERTTLSERASEEAFRKGVAALDERHYHEALGFFKTALDTEGREHATELRTKYSSYLGLALSLAHGGSEEGLRLCEQAAKRDFMDADLQCNLGIVYRRSRKKKLAFEAFRRALALKPGHKRTMEELERFERRSSPVFSFLQREHWLNQLLGRFRYRRRLRARRSSEAEV